MNYIIDATGKKLGRVASEAAAALLGKNEPGRKRNSVANIKVLISNAGKADISVKKRRTTVYETYSGYPGGLKRLTFNEVAARHGVRELVSRAVWGMLPKNTLQKRRIKNLTVTE